MKYLYVNILRSDLGDCTNDGVTSPLRSKGKRIVLAHEMISGGHPMHNIDKMADELIVLLAKQHFGGWIAIPFRKPSDDHTIGPMFGGNYVVTSDSRFSETFGRRPIPVHDRFETPEHYAELSR